jgi:hypothetical protein
MKKQMILLAAMALLAACGRKDEGQCRDQGACLNDRSCRCWCSVECDFRDKTSKDNPVYIANDPNGKYCYCKQWDLDHYEDNCIKHLNVKQPNGAQ